MTPPPAQQNDTVELALASRWFLPATVLVALIIRAAWALTHGFAIEQEGAEYARIAQNLLAGRGYVGLFDHGLQLNFPPLYPLLIAAVSLIVGDAEIAARTINIVLGAALVIPVFKLAQLAYGSRVALTAAVLVTFHPVLISGGAATYSEGPYLTVMMFALLYVVRWITERRLSAIIVAGVLFGLAYLIRPEAFVLVALFAVGGLVAATNAAERRRMIVGTAAFVGVFTLLAAPNIAFLTYNTGTLRLQAKGTLAYEWGSRINRGMSYVEAANAIGPDLSEQGVFMRPLHEVIRSASYSPKEYATFILDAARRNVVPIVHALTGEAALGSPWLFGLVVLGIFGTPWSRRRLRVDGLLVVYAATFLLTLFTVQALWFRYFYAVFGILVFWAAKGAEELYAWGRDTGTAITGSERPGTLAGAGLKYLALLLVLVFSYHNIPDVTQFQESLNVDRKAAGLWLARQGPAHKWVMDVGLQVAYYSGADLDYLPYADADLALRYVSKRNPDYVVVVGRDRSLPYMEKWFSEGIPSPRAHLVYDPVRTVGERVKIYRWDKSVQGSQLKPPAPGGAGPGS